MIILDMQGFPLSCNRNHLILMSCFIEHLLVLDYVTLEIII